jgi:hypothetical protein
MQQECNKDFADVGKADREGSAFSIARQGHGR